MWNTANGCWDGICSRAAELNILTEGIRMATGKIKWFNDAKGYGFIELEDGEDVFVHYTAIAGEGYRTLAEGAEVEFTIDNDPKGPRAANVIVTGQSSPAADSEPEAEVEAEAEAEAEAEVEAVEEAEVEAVEEAVEEADEDEDEDAEAW